MKALFQQLTKKLTGRETGTPNPGASVFFFPLRTNVEYFASPGGFLTLERRIKQAALLYDVLMFEGGMYIATIGETGSVDLWKPDVTDEELSEPVKPTGGDYYFAVGPGGSTQRHVLQSGPVERRFRSEFQSFVKRLGPRTPEWVQVKTYDPTPEAKNSINQLTEQDLKNPEMVIPEAGRWLQSKIISNLNHDLLLIQHLKCAASMDPLHIPLLPKKMTGLKPASGFLATEVLVPDFSKLSWEVIAEIRKQKAVEEFRRRVRQVEDLARVLLPDGDQKDLSHQVSQLMTDELLGEVNNLMPKTGSTVRNILINLISGVLPYHMGTIPTVGASIVDIVKLRKAKDSWVTVFMRLRTGSKKG